MKLKKLISFAAAATVAASVAATTASADWAPVPDAVGGLSSSNQLYMIPLFCNVESPDIPLTDRGIDLAKLGYVSFTFQIDEADREFFDGQFGGGLGISLHAKNIVKPEEVTAEDKVKEKPDGTPTTMWGYYNWDNSRQYWGVIDNEAPDPNSYDIDGEYIEGMPKYINYMGAEDEFQSFLEPMGNYTYRIKTDLVNPIVEGDCTVEDITDVRVFLQSWQSSMFKAEVTRCVIFDTDNKAIMAFDSKGNQVDTTADDEKEPVRPEPYVEGEEGDTSTATSDTASTATSDNASVATSDAASSTASAANSAAASSAPAASAAASTTSTASDNGGMPVGAIVGIIAGVVVVVVIIIVVVKKKKG